MISRLVSLAILPAQLIGTSFGKSLTLSYSKDEVDNAKNYLKSKLPNAEITIPTKDGVKLNAMLFKKAKNKASKISNFFSKIFKIDPKELKSKIWINFNGNAICYEFLNINQIRKIQSLGFDVLAFNYRSVAKSEGKPTQKGLIEDGKAIIRYAHKLGYDDIYVHGHSLGGAIAIKALAQLKEEDREVYNKVKLIADRTFSSIKAVLKTFNLFLIIKWLVIKIVSFANWNIKVRKDWESIDIKKCLFYAPKDLNITQDSSLYKKICKTTDKDVIVPLRSYGHNDQLTIGDLKKAISILA